MRTDLSSVSLGQPRSYSRVSGGEFELIFMVILKIKNERGSTSRNL
jgi:hypothetical protein